VIHPSKLDHALFVQDPEKDHDDDDEDYYFTPMLVSVSTKRSNDDDNDNEDETSHEHIDPSTDRHMKTHSSRGRRVRTIQDLKPDNDDDGDSYSDDDISIDHTPAKKLRIIPDKVKPRKKREKKTEKEEKVKAKPTSRPKKLSRRGKIDFLTILRIIPDRLVLLHLEQARLDREQKVRSKFEIAPNFNIRPEMISYETYTVLIKTSREGLGIVFERNNHDKAVVTGFLDNFIESYKITSSTTKRSLDDLPITRIAPPSFIEVGDMLIGVNHLDVRSGHSYDKLMKMLEWKEPVPTYPGERKLVRISVISDMLSLKFARSRSTIASTSDHPAAASQASAFSMKEIASDQEKCQKFYRLAATTMTTKASATKITVSMPTSSNISSPSFESSALPATTSIAIPSSSEKLSAVVAEQEEDNIPEEDHRPTIFHFASMPIKSSSMSSVSSHMRGAAKPPAVDSQVDQIVVPTTSFAGLPQGSQSNPVKAKPGFPRFRPTLTTAVSSSSVNSTNINKSTS
jgi:hypothetical protein